ncbi:hypothetical protein H310_12099 [Aphanomyces invadans]|uniref:Uncharacterized protein n=1 Tax=Aphanomyces invadans TaxID=157072 RepID=A0A024TL47_9STRA|nr:hypothetical protein H310_12099 [Aphanomyces invadans]ETV94067.1 hypothetical protein H310_12099 [Aphanomyces invadans]|eukprot:XP_008877270.1 hypothetical protein H310_12099 [Aphanomyces invadans]
MQYALSGDLITPKSPHEPFFYSHPALLHTIPSTIFSSCAIKSRSVCCDTNITVDEGSAATRASFASFRSKYNQHTNNNNLSTGANYVALPRCPPSLATGSARTSTAGCIDDADSASADVVSKLSWDAWVTALVGRTGLSSDAAAAGKVRALLHHFCFVGVPEYTATVQPTMGMIAYMDAPPQAHPRRPPEPHDPSPRPSRACGRHPHGHVMRLHWRFHETLDPPRRPNGVHVYEVSFEEFGPSPRVPPTPSLVCGAGRHFLASIAHDAFVSGISCALSTTQSRCCSWMMPMGSRAKGHKTMSHRAKGRFPCLIKALFATAPFDANGPRSPGLSCRCSVGPCASRHIPLAAIRQRLRYGVPTWNVVFRRLGRGEGPHGRSAEPNAGMGGSRSPTRSVPGPNPEKHGVVPDGHCAGRWRHGIQDVEGDVVGRGRQLLPRALGVGALDARRRWLVLPGPAWPHVCARPRLPSDGHPLGRRAKPMGMPAAAIVDGVSAAG